MQDEIDLETGKYIQRVGEITFNGSDDEKWKVGYRYYDLHTDEIWYPFGYGLSYTKFQYDNLSINNTEDGFTVECRIKNIGDIAGKDAVQVYFSDRVSTFSRPLKELITFRKTNVINRRSNKYKFRATTINYNR